MIISKMKKVYHRERKYAIFRDEKQK